MWVIVVLSGEARSLRVALNLMTIEPGPRDEDAADLLRNVEIEFHHSHGFSLPRPPVSKKPIRIETDARGWWATDAAC